MGTWEYCEIYQRQTADVETQGLVVVTFGPSGIRYGYFGKPQQFGLTDEDFYSWKAEREEWVIRKAEASGFYALSAFLWEKLFCLRLSEGWEISPVKVPNHPDSWWPKEFSQTRSALSYSMTLRRYTPNSQGGLSTTESEQ